MLSPNDIIHLNTGFEMHHYMNASNDSLAMT